MPSRAAARPASAAYMTAAAAASATDSGTSAATAAAAKDSTAAGAVPTTRVAALRHAGRGCRKRHRDCKRCYCANDLQFHNALHLHSIIQPDASGLVPISRGTKLQGNRCTADEQIALNSRYPDLSLKGERTGGELDIPAARWHQPLCIERCNAKRMRR
jgi:hypothetical protein